ncbi:MAG: hypothetical protein KAK00_10935 [Nanoarchaeota archaeon]|nr:hypothetical protein [Nanoarchaeota archaeon]
MDTNLIMNYIYSSKDRIIHRSKIESILTNFSVIPDINKVLLYLRRSNRIKYLFKGYYYILNSDELANKYYEYSINEMVFVILNKLNVKWYIGLQSSLEYNKLVWQAHNVLIILNNQFSKEITIDGNKIRFRKMKENYMFGFKTKKTNNRIIFHYSGVEKTIVDFAYFRVKRPAELFQQYDDIKVKEYLMNYSKLIKKRVVYDE